MSFKQVIVLSCVLFAAYVECSISWGSCPNLKTQADFDPTKYLGLWYEYGKIPYVFERNGKCTTATYGAGEDGKVTVFNSQINRESGEPETISGYAEVVSGAKLNVVLEVLPGFSPSAPYWVLDTDYTSYSVVWSCTKVGFVRQDSAWILTRERFPSEEVIAKAKSALVKQNISLDQLTITEQTGCKN